MEIVISNNCSTDNANEVCLTYLKQYPDKIKYINQEKPITLNQNVRFHFIWIEDFCKIVDYFIKNPTKEKFINVTPTESIEIVEIANIVNNFSDFKAKKRGLKI